MHCLALSRQIGHYHNARFRAAAARFDKFTVLSCAGEGFFAEFSAKSFDGYTVETLANGRDEYAALVASGEFMTRVAAVLDRLKPDAIAVPGWASAESFAALTWARKTNTPVIVMAESQQDDVGRSSAKEALKSHIVKQFDAALAGGFSTRDYLVQLGMPHDRIGLGYNAVDNDHFARGAEEARLNAADLRQEHGLPERYFLSSGRFIGKKNFPLLVQAYAKARQELGDTLPDLVILGDGDERQAIEDAIATADLAAHVHLPGYKGYDLLPIMYGLSQGFVHVATREQWGLVINEAMASKVPVIVSDRCGATRTLLKQGKGGYVVDPFNADDIAKALADLASQTPEDWAAMAQDAFDTVADWGPDRFGDGMLHAVTAARSAKRRGALPVWDRVLLNRLGKRVYTDVD
ncbi:glycosyltransferase [Tropicibacter sp. R15_0]|uniref:glycosyltransferase n=1 Tax=Tropicibacter sp. R15_0 TaxID=2821101 RepID=UPI001ADA6987|nr:glycosyltransferase [Tropicibacter sp. R15_0]MBO9467534.1 glycosyltransferase [Tropicibacter sp. R15_0]